MTTREYKVEKDIREWAQSQNILVFKFTSPGNAGVPDRLFIFSGLVVFMEIKRPGKKLRALQQFQIDRLRAHGAVADWCDSAESGIEKLKKYFSL